MPSKRTFHAVIQSDGGGGAFVQLPFDVEAAFGSKRPKVMATIDGIPYRGTLVRMGTDCHILGVLKEIRQKLGKDCGDQVKVTVTLDSLPRVVEIPEDLGQALSEAPKAKAVFDKMSYSHQREYVKHVTEAKKPETRARRIAQTIETLKTQQTRPR